MLLYQLLARCAASESGMAKRIQERDWFDCVESRRKMRGYSRCVVLAGVAILYVLSPISTLAETGPQHSEVTVVDDSAPSHPFPHFWEKMFGSGRAIFSLRASYRDDLRRVKGITDFEYVRFHAIFHDEVEVYDEDAQGHPTYNFSYVDQIYDGLLASGVRPFVELSFMPQKLAADKGALHSFWYRPNVSPPKDYAKWDDMIRQFIRHLVDRYGIGEVSQWYFEVWNEPNLDFWSGDPKQATYFEIYDHTARAIKSVNARLLASAARQRPKLRGQMLLSGTVLKIMFQLISFHPTSMATTHHKMFSAPPKRFRATKWSAEPSRTFTTRFWHLLCPDCHWCGANSMPAT